MAEPLTQLNAEQAEWLLRYFDTRMRRLSAAIRIACEANDAQVCLSIIEEMEEIDAFTSPYIDCPCGLPHSQKFARMRELLGQPREEPH